MGGAGFPTGQKWELVRDTEPGSVKYVICQRRMSPSPERSRTGKILATEPHLVLEGLLIGMAVVGAEEGWVFIRHEYGPEEQVVRAELEALRAAGVVGRDACGSGRRLELDVFVSPGGYILERRRHFGMHGGPSRRAAQQAPLPGNYGLHGRPTLNELRRDPGRCAGHRAARGAVVDRPGHRRGGGLKFFAVSGTSSGPMSTWCRWAPRSAG